MFSRFFRAFTAVAIAGLLTMTITLAPALAMTLSFKTEGVPKRDGLLQGKVVLSQDALQDAIKRTSAGRSTAKPVPLSEIEGAEFTLKYVSPYSGVEHSEKTLCGKAIYDINGFEEVGLAGGTEPVLIISPGGVPESVDFSSCIGEPGDAESSISEQDSRIVFSSLDSLFGKLSVFDRDIMGNELYRKIQPIKFTLKQD
ncbi:MAG: hypothetical protein AAF609_18660 [Cyanobacteria bacterium P01_C01_bin.120]